MYNSKPLIAVSACLLGKPVRYDGGSKSLPYLAHHLSTHCQLTELCPEVSIGMSVPRPPIQVVLENEKRLARGIADPNQEFTQPLKQCATQHLQQNPMVCGYILKARSPSCGINTTPIYQSGKPITTGSGIFAQQIQHQRPWLPLCNEEDLANPELRDHFLQRVFIQQQILQCQTQQDRRQLLDSLQLTLFSYGHSQVVDINDTQQEYFNQDLMTLMRAPAKETQHAIVIENIIEQLKISPHFLKETNGDWRLALAYLREKYSEHPQIKDQHYLVKNPHEWKLRFVDTPDAFPL